MNLSESQYIENEIGVIGGHWYQERVKSLINRCHIALTLCANDQHLLPTITEDIAYSALELCSDYCIKED